MLPLLSLGNKWLTASQLSATAAHTSIISAALFYRIEMCLSSRTFQSDVQHSLNYWYHFL